MAQRRAPIPTRPATGQRRSRLQQERRRIRLLLALGAIGLVLIASIVAVGYYITFVGPPQQTVVKVNDTRYTLGDLVKILRSYQWGSQGSQQPLDLSRLPFDVVNLLMENEVIKQNAPQLGIVVTDAEVIADIRKTMIGERKDDTTPQQQLDREFRERYRRLLNGTKLSEKEHHALVRTSLLRDRVRERVSEQAPSVAPQYHLYSLTLENEQLAKEARTEFERGVAFKDLVAKYSANAEIVRKEGEVGWIPEKVYAQLDEIATKLEPGVLSDIRNEVVQGAPGQAGKVQYALYLVKEKEKARELDEDQRKLFREQALQKWIAEQRAKSIVETSFGSEEYTWVVQQLRKTEPPTRRAPQTAG